MKLPDVLLRAWPCIRIYCRYGHCLLRNKGHPDARVSNTSSTNYHLQHHSTHRTTSQSSMVSTWPESTRWPSGTATSGDQAKITSSCAFSSGCEAPLLLDVSPLGINTRGAGGNVGVPDACSWEGSAGGGNLRIRTRLGWGFAVTPFAPSCAASVARETYAITASVSAEAADACSSGDTRSGRTRRTRLDSFAASSAAGEAIASEVGAPTPLALRTFFFLDFPFVTAPADPFCRVCNFGAMLTSVLVVSKSAFPEVEGSSDTPACVRQINITREREPTNSEANPCSPQYPDVDLLPHCSHPYLREKG